jgi:hypothetical protein
MEISALAFRNLHVASCVVYGVVLRSPRGVVLRSPRGVNRTVIFWGFGVVVQDIISCCVLLWGLGGLVFGSCVFFVVL